MAAGADAGMAPGPSDDAAAAVAAGMAPDDAAAAVAAGPEDLELLRWGCNQKSTVSLDREPYSNLDPQSQNRQGRVSIESNKTFVREIKKSE